MAAAGRDVKSCNDLHLSSYTYPVNYPGVLALVKQCLKVVPQCNPYYRIAEKVQVSLSCSTRTLLILKDDVKLPLVITLQLGRTPGTTPENNGWERLKTSQS